MTTRLEVLQGSNTIGGNIVLIEGENSRLILDLGIPLTDSDGEGVNLSPTQNTINKYLPKIQDLYSERPKKETLIFCSHAHPDHFGLMRFVNKNIPIYTSGITKDLINKSSLILYKNMFDNLNLKDMGTSLKTEDFLIENLPVNHSVGGASAFLITDKKSEKKIVYSGDLRLHGRTNNELLAEKARDCDYLIIEGTSLGRESCKTLTEREVEDKMARIFNEDKISIVACSALNTDRIQSVYNACKSSGKTFVIDPYTAFILETFKGSDLPEYMSENIKVYCVWNNSTKKVFSDREYMKFKYNKIEFKEILANPQKYVVKDNFETTGYLEKYLDFSEVNLIYSYWEGYLENESYRWHKYKSDLKKIHTSGHISPDDLKFLVDKINPQKILPVHTLATNKFRELYKSKIIEGSVEIS